MRVTRTVKTPPPVPKAICSGGVRRAETPEVRTPEGVDPEGAAPEGAAPEGATPEGATPEGVDPEGAAPEVTLFVEVLAEVSANGCVVLDWTGVGAGAALRVWPTLSAFHAVPLSSKRKKPE